MSPSFSPPALVHGLHASEMVLIPCRRCTVIDTITGPHLDQAQEASSTAGRSVYREIRQRTRRWRKVLSLPLSLSACPRTRGDALKRSTG